MPRGERVSSLGRTRRHSNGRTVLGSPRRRSRTSGRSSREFQISVAGGSAAKLRLKPPRRNPSREAQLRCITHYLQRRIDFTTRIERVVRSGPGELSELQRPETEPTRYLSP